jgi:DNA-binding CsgD family transcriptional regulator
VTAENQVVQKLRGVAAKLTVDADLQKDVLQEMVIHWANVAVDRPGQTRSWYIKNCEFRARNYLSRGRSVDSYKRAHNIVSLGEPISGAEAHYFIVPESLTAQDEFDEILTRDVLDQLTPKLTGLQQEILKLLMQDLGVREVGRKLGISHPAVIKHRRKIAHLAQLLLREPSRRVRTVV